MALALAARTGGVIVNADSMQVYRELPILTARPTADDERQVPHRLYGHVGLADAYSVGRYARDAALVLDDLRREGRPAIVVGGTGLYFKALTEGLSPVPPIPDDVRARMFEPFFRVNNGNADTTERFVTTFAGITVKDDMFC